MLEYTKKEDIRIIINDIKTLRQGNDRSITRDEFNEKWKKLRMEIDCSFAERPTINYVRQIIAAQDDKVSIINDQLNEELERLDQCLNILDTEVKGYDDRFTDIGKQLNERLLHSDAKKIWDYFTRFAEYSDLKDLYNKVIPELAKFEQKI